MWKSIRQWWKYLAMKLHVLHEEKADPKVQIEQAIDDARAKDRALRDQAAQVIANAKQAEGRLEKAVVAYDKANAQAEQALLLADREGKGGDAAKSARFDDAAASLASKAIRLEQEIGELEEQFLQATQAADGTRAAVQQNGEVLKRQLDEKQQLLDKLDQAKVQEKMNDAMEQLATTVGADVPTFAEVSKKIETRLAKAQAHGELNAARITTPEDAVILEVEQAQRSAEAQAWLSERRTKLGLAGAARAADGRVETAEE